MLRSGLDSSGMRRFTAIGITVLLLWALVPGVGELLENAVHFAQEGHFAHAAPEGDEHDSPGPEHGCASAVHLCSCCLSINVLTARAAVQGPDFQPQLFAARTHTCFSSILNGGIDHPPRA